MDEALEAMTRERLVAEVRRLRAGIRTHRDSTGHALYVEISQHPFNEALTLTSGWRSAPAASALLFDSRAAWLGR